MTASPLSQNTMSYIFWEYRKTHLKLQCHLSITHTWWVGNVSKRNKTTSDESWHIKLISSPKNILRISFASFPCLTFIQIPLCHIKYWFKLIYSYRICKLLAIQPINFFCDWITYIHSCICLSFNGYFFIIYSTFKIPDAVTYSD